MILAMTTNTLLTYLKLILMKSTSNSSPKDCHSALLPTKLAGSNLKQTFLISHVMCDSKHIFTEKSLLKIITQMMITFENQYLKDGLL